ncbi:MAG: cysteine synthase family protein [Desulfovibrio sp.]|jgi:cysteine synthase B|nr:cysteine synthase family protein [Desulfovibrio sp.]
MGILDLVGGTPILELRNIAASVPGVRILAKAEFCNPSGSVKDRAARAMLLDGSRRGALTRDRGIIDATSGNTGIAYAMLGAALGYSVTLYMPANTGRLRKGIIRRYGASIVETDPLEGSDGAYLAARAAVEEHPQLWFYPDQYNNPANPLAHYEGTGPEIWRQSGGRVSHFVAAMGTSGTFVGVSRRLKEYDPRVRCLAVQPDSPFHGIEGTKHLASTLCPGIFEKSLADDFIPVSTEQAYAMTRRLAAEEGVLVGVSSGCNVQAALILAGTLPPGSTVVTVLCDSGNRYIFDSFWEERP